MNYYTKVVEEPIRVYPRSWNVDGRGQLAEILRMDDQLFKDFRGNKVGQFYCTTVSPCITKAWHMHKKQTDRMMLLAGCVRFGCVDPDDDVLLDLVVDAQDPCMIIIPPRIAHGFKNVGSTPAYIVNVPDHMYDSTNPDEHRFPAHSFECFDWNASLDG